MWLTLDAVKKGTGWRPTDEEARKVLFEDPDGIRLELNHVPGKGLLG